MENTLARNAAEDLTKGLGRRGFMRAVAALGAGVGVAGVASGCAHSNASPAGSIERVAIGLDASVCPILTTAP